MKQSEKNNIAKELNEKGLIKSEDTLTRLLDDIEDAEVADIKKDILNKLFLQGSP